MKAVPPAAILGRFRMKIDGRQEPSAPLPFPGSIWDSQGADLFGHNYSQVYYGSNLPGVATGRAV